MVSGIGWSIAQVLSFIPNIVGQIAGLIGMILVIYHWVQIAKINKLLIDRLEMVHMNINYIAQEALTPNSTYP